MDVDILIIGAGISGLTLAERYSSLGDLKILVIDKRDHIGGNCYDYINDIGILVPKYGPHFFHTNCQKVWDYVSKFTDWHNYHHRVRARINGHLVPVPVNIETVNKLLNINLKNENDFNNFIKNEVIRFDEIINSEQSALSRVGPRLYELVFKNYTKKQWDKEPEYLNSSVLDRIPVRDNYDDRYFNDTFQAMPKKGYSKLFQNMVKNQNIKIMLNVDYFNIKDSIKFKKMFFTGPIDRFFDFIVGEKLEYRSLKFEFENIDKEFYQPFTTINFPNEFQYTRITEPKHATGQKHPSTTIIREYPTWEGEGYYPVPSVRNNRIYENYQELANKYEDDNIFFIGRLATYKYINMDQAFQYALELFERLEFNK